VATTEAQRHSADVAPTTTREQQVIDFFAEWGKSLDAACDSFTTILADDCIWDQRPIPRIKGPRAAVRFLKVTHATLGMQTIDVQILRIAAAGDVVHVERVDRLLRADGSLIAAAPVAGVLEFNGDQVVRWREYFDAGGFLAQTLATSSLYLARRAAHLLTSQLHSRRG
jgi:limonene-1,2-epoxide hydrolase